MYKVLDSKFKVNDYFETIETTKGSYLILDAGYQYG